MGQPPEAVSQSGAAGTYTVVLQQRSTLVRSPTVVEDVEVIGVITSPSGIYFERAVPYANWLASSADPLIAPISGRIEQIIGAGTADTAWFTQDVDPSGLIINQMTFQVSIPATATSYGPMTTNVIVTIQDLYNGTGYQAAFTAAVAALNAIAGT